MTDDVAREADVFARYLSGRPPSGYVAGCYAAGQAALTPPRTRLEATLLRVARTHPLLTRAADAFGRAVAPRSALRQKLVLMTAILESSHPTNRDFDPLPRSLPGAALALAAAGVAFLLALVLGLVVVGLWHAATIAGGRR
jgi:hypothetical protein